MVDQELGFNFISLSAHRPSRSVFAKGLRAAIASPNYENLGIDEDDIFVSDDAKSDVSCLQMLFGSKDSMAVQDLSYPLVPLHLAVGISGVKPITAVVSNSQGELEDGPAFVIDINKSACRTLQAKATSQKDMFEEQKRSMSEPAGVLALAGVEAYCKHYGLKGENVVATTWGANMDFDRLRLVAELAARQREPVLATCMPEEPKGAGTSEGETPRGEEEDDVTVPHEVYYVFKERLKDDDLLFPLSSQPPAFALSQRQEEGEHCFDLPQRAEEREHNFALSQRAEGTENKNWVKGLGSTVLHVICIGMRAAVPCVGLFLLNRNAGKKLDDLALQLKEINEALGAPGPPPTASVSNQGITIGSLLTLFSFGNQSVRVSPPGGLFNSRNPIAATPFFGLINIGQFKIGNGGNGVEENGNK